MGETDKDSKGGYANKDNKQPSVTKVLIKWEGHRFTYFDISRVTPVDEYDKDSPTGLKYGFCVHTMGWPSETKFFYGTPELRDRKQNEFDIKMVSCKAMII